MTYDADENSASTLNSDLEASAQSSIRSSKSVSEEPEILQNTTDDSKSETPIIAKPPSKKKGAHILRTPQLFNDRPSKTDEAKNTFVELIDCTYSNKYMGDSGQEEIMTCDCKEHWGKFFSCTGVFSFFLRTSDHLWSFLTRS